MEPNLKEWLDRNARVVRDSGNAWYHLDHGAPVIGIDGDVPYVAIEARGARLYTDAMEYCNHGLGDGMLDPRREGAVINILPRRVYRAVKAWYTHDGDIDDDALAGDLAEYLRGRTGWVPNKDYFDRPHDTDVVWAAIRALDIPHVECEDEEND